MMKERSTIDPGSPQAEMVYFKNKVDVEIVRGLKKKKLKPTLYKLLRKSLFQFSLIWRTNALDQLSSPAVHKTKYYWTSINIV